MDKYEIEFEKKIQEIIKELKRLEKQCEIVWLDEDIYEIIDKIEHHIYIGEKNNESTSKF